MKIAFFSSKPYDEQFFNKMNAQLPAEQQHDIHFIEARLRRATSILAKECDAVCAFVNDKVDAEVLALLASHGVKTVAMRCAGYNNVDVPAAHAHGLKVVRVPAYSPYAVAEHALGLMMTLNRKYHRAYNRVRDGNFSLVGLVGFDMHGKTVGVVGTGKIGATLVPILKGFGCKVLAYDVYENPELVAMGVSYVKLETLLAQSDIVSLHCPLLPSTYHLINNTTVGLMKRGAMLINTSRGGLIQTDALIDGLKSGQLGSVGLDVYEEEESLFFRDLSNSVIQDDVFSRLLTFPNVLITGHQAFFTETALCNIAETTLHNLLQIEVKEACPNEILV
jgi:D-lactate dehydrogenase